LTFNYPYESLKSKVQDPEGFFVRDSEIMNNEHFLDPFLEPRSVALQVLSLSTSGDEVVTAGV
jgi:hypothetical protein